MAILLLITNCGRLLCCARNDRKTLCMLIKKGGCTYILTNFYNTVLYTGVTSDLKHRIGQHKNKVSPCSFTAKYNCDKLVWFEIFSDIADAIMREKQIKAGNRKRKEDLIHAINPHWNDLWEEIQYW